MKSLSEFRCETIGNCTLYLGDCRDILPLLSNVDAVVTDPPYGLDTPSGTISKKRKGKREYASISDTSEQVTEVYVPAVKQALHLAGGRGIVTPGGKHAWEYPKPDVLGAFYQPASTGMCLWGRATMQAILFYGKDPNVGLTIQNTTYTLTEAPEKNGHPCPKPLKAWTWVVWRASRVGDVVLDPFMGSGTTGVACQRLGRKFIGIEIDPDYFEIACGRIREASLQPDFFHGLHTGEKHKQERMI